MDQRHRFSCSLEGDNLSNNFIVQCRTANVLTIGSRSGHAGAHAISDERTFKFGKTGHDREDEFALRRCGVDAFLQANKVNAKRAEFRKRIDEGMS